MRHQASLEMPTRLVPRMAALPAKDAVELGHSRSRAKTIREAWSAAPLSDDFPSASGTLVRATRGDEPPRDSMVDTLFGLGASAAGDDWETSDYTSSRAVVARSPLGLDETTPGIERLPATHGPRRRPIGWDHESMRTAPVKPTAARPAPRSRPKQQVTAEPLPPPPRRIGDVLAEACGTFGGGVSHGFPAVMEPLPPALQRPAAGLSPQPGRRWGRVLVLVVLALLVGAGAGFGVLRLQGWIGVDEATIASQVPVITVADPGLVDTGLVDTGLVDTGLVDTGLVDTGLVRSDTMPRITLGSFKIRRAKPKARPLHLRKHRPTRRARTKKSKRIRVDEILAAGVLGAANHRP